MTASPEGRAFIRGYEKCVPIPYDDARPRYVLKPGDKVKGFLTVGYGHTGSDIVIGEKWNKARCESVFDSDLGRFERAVCQMVTAPVGQSQFDALVSFAFNCGEGNLRKSSLLKKVNARAPVHEVQAEFRKWIRSGGVVMRGLVDRRDHEAAMYGRGDRPELATIQPLVSTTSAITPEPVVREDAEVKKSPDIWGLLGIGGAGGGVALGNVSNAVSGFRDAVSGTDLKIVVTVCGVVIVGIAAWLLVKRLREIMVHARR